MPGKIDASSKPPTKVGGFDFYGAFPGLDFIGVSFEVSFTKSRKTLVI